MLNNPFGGWPITRSPCDDCSNGIWLTTTCDNVNWFDGINLLSLSTEVKAIVLPFINLKTLVGGSESNFDDIESHFFCSFAWFPLKNFPFSEISIAWRMPFLPFNDGVAFLICKPFDALTELALTFTFNGIAAFVAANRAGEIPSFPEKFIDIGGGGAVFKPFECDVKPFGRTFFRIWGWVTDFFGDDTVIFWFDTILLLVVFAMDVVNGFELVIKGIVVVLTLDTVGLDECTRCGDDVNNSGDVLDTFVITGDIDVVFADWDY